MYPLNRINISSNGNDEDRIGPNIRNAKLSNYSNIEALLDHLTPLTVSFDVSPLHPPYFTEFTYVDILDGISVLTQSAEINSRIAIKASQTKTNKKFPIDDAIDKYELIKPPRYYNKVIFLPGGNAMNMVDHNKLQRIMFEDSEWMIKLHPVSEDILVRELASVFGYNRLIDREVSGMEILKNAKVIASVDTSELLILARFLDIPAINITSYFNGWRAAYHHICRLINNDDTDKERLTNLFMSDYSGHLRTSYDESLIVKLATNYFDYAMKEREKFKMVTNQGIQVIEKIIGSNKENV